MSKEAMYDVELEKVSKMVMDEAVRLLEKELKAVRVSMKEFMIYGNKKIEVKGIGIKLPNCAFPIDIRMEDGKLTICGDSMDVRYAAGVIKQFYGAVEVAMKFRSRATYNHNTREMEVLLAGV